MFDKNLKIQIIGLVLFFILGIIGVSIYVHNRPKEYSIYHNIREVSHFNNKWVLYSGITYGNDVNSIIEYQIYPCFEGSKKECEQEKIKSQLFLKVMLLEMKKRK